MKRLLIPALVALTSISCSSTNLMSLSVMEPAPVTIAPDIRTVGIVSRTLPEDRNRVLDALHRVESLEGKDIELEGARSSVDGLQAQLTRNNRFEQVKFLDNVDLRGFGAGVFPSPLTWEQVTNTCRDNGVDALFVLEVFTTDTKFDYAAKPASLQTPVGNVNTLEHQVNMRTSVRTGWRIYDPAHQAIYDEYTLNRDMNFASRSINPLEAAEGLMERKEEVKKVGYAAGQAYASRIQPYWIRVSRDYFIKGNDEFTQATRYARAGQWDEAGKLWMANTRNADHTIAGRACYNMAIISEINGDLDGAITWAQKAYTEHGNRLALGYISMLRNRKYNKEVLDHQMTATNEEVH
jgi:Family of unknown function (DUF6340)